MNETQIIAKKAPPSKGEASEPNFIDTVNLFFKHKKIIAAIPLIAAICAAAISFALPDVYRAGTKLLPPQQPQSGAAALLSQLGGVAGAAASAGIKNPNDLYLGMLRSRTLADKLIAQYELKKVYGTDSQEKARKILEENSIISSGKDGLIFIEVEDENQQRVAPLANSYADELLKLTRMLTLTEASQRRVFFEQQLEQSKNNLAKAEMTLKGALDSHGVISVDSESRAMVETIGRMQAQISAKESQLGAMRAFVTETNPDFRRVEEELKGLRAEQEKLENGRGIVNGGAGDRNKQVGLANIKTLRDVKYYQMLYELLSKQYEVARLDEAKEASVIQVLDLAVSPERKFKPKRAIIVILSIVLAFFATLSWIFFAETWRRHGNGLVRE